MDAEFYCMHSELCKTLANDKRQMILGALRGDELSVGQLVERTGIPQANLSQHLSIMRGRGVVNTRREGTRVFYSISNPKLIQAFDLITEVMQEQGTAHDIIAGWNAGTQDVQDEESYVPHPRVGPFLGIADRLRTDIAALDDQLDAGLQRRLIKQVIDRVDGDYRHDQVGIAAKEKHLSDIGQSHRRSVGGIASERVLLQLVAPPDESLVTVFLGIVDQRVHQTWVCLYHAGKQVASGLVGTHQFAVPLPARQSVVFLRVGIGHESIDACPNLHGENDRPEALAALAHLGIGVFRPRSDGGERRPAHLQQVAARLFPHPEIAVAEHVHE